VENETLEFKKTEDIKPEGNFVKAICFKPKRAPIICIAIGICLLIPNNTIVRLLGLFFIAMAILVLKYVKDYKVMDIFDKGVMIYGDQENKTACFINFDQIEMWSIKHEDGQDTIIFDLGEKGKIIKESFEADKAYRALYVLIREKEENYIIAQKNKDKPLSIPDALNNIKNTFLKK
jgi:hypothetical protein